MNRAGGFPGTVWPFTPYIVSRHHTISAAMDDIRRPITECVAESKAGKVVAAQILPELELVVCYFSSVGTAEHNSSPSQYRANFQFENKRMKQNISIDPNMRNGSLIERAISQLSQKLLCAGTEISKWVQ